MQAISQLLIKSKKAITVHTGVVDYKKFFCKYFTELLPDGSKVPTQGTLARVGDASLYVETVLQDMLPQTKAEIYSIFGGRRLQSVSRVFQRSKGALSIETKLLRGLEKHGQFESIDDAVRLIEDGIGSRVITKPLKRLSKKEIDTMIHNTTIDGRKLTDNEIQLLKKYIYSTSPSKESEEAFRLYEAFAQPLIEKRSQEVVDELALGILKFRALERGLDLQKMASRGLIDKHLYERLLTEDITPIRITEINNYKGAHGLAEFSDSQIRQLFNALNFERAGKPVKIISDVRGLGADRYSAEDLAEISRKTIKASGYRTAQMNLVHANGALGEIQFRGPMTNMIGEYEHIAYDLRQGKNTLGPLFDEFTYAVKSLSSDDYKEYNKYLEECYNYYHKIELGLPAVKPKMPKQLPKVLSEDSMKALHDEAEKIDAIANEGFYRHIEAVA